jgi:hypothetical protein
VGRSIRFSIAGLMGVVVIVAVGLAALRKGSEAFAGVIFLTTSGVLGLAVLGAALAEGRPRQIWLGAAIFGTGYMILVFSREPVPHPTPSLPTDQLLSAARSWFPLMPQGVFTSFTNEAANARIIKSLEKNIPMPFPNDTPLDDVLQHIKQQTRGPDGKGIPIYVDPIGLQEAERSLTSTVTIDVHDVPLGTSLRLCLKQLGLGYGIRDGFLMITSDESIPPAFEDPFLMGGHCFLALIAAAVGGLLAPLVATARSR